MGPLSTPGRPWARPPGKPRSLQAVSEDRPGQPGSSLTPLGALQGSPWAAEGAQRHLQCLCKKKCVFNCFEHGDDLSNMSIFVNANEPSLCMHQNLFKLLCHVDFGAPLQNGPPGSPAEPPSLPWAAPGPSQAPPPGISLLCVPECPVPWHHRYI